MNQKLLSKIRQTAKKEYATLGCRIAFVRGAVYGWFLK